jgi:hypothetical protein
MSKTKRFLVVDHEDDCCFDILTAASSKAAAQKYVKDDCSYSDRAYSRFFRVYEIVSSQPELFQAEPSQIYTVTAVAKLPEQ